MKLFSKYCAFAMVIAVALTANALPAMGKGTHGLATITGTVRDNKGAPLAGALVQLIREGAKQIVKQTYTAADGSFSAKIPAGRYSLKAIAAGFSEVLFESVQVNPSAEIAYRFNLEPANSSKTLVNQRNDKDSVKWTLRSAQSRKSILQANTGNDPIRGLSATGSKWPKSRRSRQPMNVAGSVCKAWLSNTSPLRQVHSARVTRA